MKVPKNDLRKSRANPNGPNRKPSEFASLQLFNSVEDPMSNMLTETIAQGCSLLRRIIGAVALLALASMSQTASSAQSKFDSPEAAVAALIEAVESDDQPALRAVLGLHGSKLIRSGNAVADRRNRESFIQAYGEANKIVVDGGRRAELLIGKDGWPMPIPLVKAPDGNWRFDPHTGEVEVLFRRNGRNELAAIQVCLAVVDAEREYTSSDRDGDGLREYAARFTSTPGKRDGLYWATEGDEKLSPLGPLLAVAVRDGYAGAGAGILKPYHGYFYKLLTRQGKDAPGGAYGYFVNGKMVAGFALIAYPARYGASGIMSFMVSQDGIVYEKNLGRNTKSLASALTTFNPDASWKPVQERVPVTER
jgi:hypothetical protein